MDKDFMLNYYDKMVRPTWTELMKTPRYQRAACEHDKLEREFRRLLDEKLGRKYLELDDALFRVMDDIAEAMYMKGAADRELMKTPRYQRAACEHDKLEREFRRLLDEKLGRKYLELDDALFRVMDDIAEAMYMKGAADRELMIR